MSPKKMRHGEHSQPEKTKGPLEKVSDWDKQIEQESRPDGLPSRGTAEGIYAYNLEGNREALPFDDSALFEPSESARFCLDEVRSRTVSGWSLVPAGWH